MAVQIIDAFRHCAHQGLRPPGKGTTRRGNRRAEINRREKHQGRFTGRDARPPKALPKRPGTRPSASLPTPARRAGVAVPGVRELPMLDEMYGQNGTRNAGPVPRRPPPPTPPIPPTRAICLKRERCHAFGDISLSRLVG
ncbi:hypothetical protein GCM10023088_29920 [Actinomadura verrucosospora]